MHFGGGGGVGSKNAVSAPFRETYDYEPQDLAETEFLKNNAFQKSQRMTKNGACYIMVRDDNVHRKLLENGVNANMGRGFGANCCASRNWSASM